MSLDQRRIESRRNGCCPCYKKEEMPANLIQEKSRSEKIFAAYADVLLQKPSMIVVAIVTLAMTGIGIRGNILLEQQFDPTWFLPPGSIHLIVFY
jgi:hypothetical protein